MNEKEGGGAKQETKEGQVRQATATDIEGEGAKAREQGRTSKAGDSKGEHRRRSKARERARNDE